MTLETLGTPPNGVWPVVTDGLSKDSIIYSFGAGDDVSWELAMIQRFGCKVHVFDPDPDSVSYVQSLALPPEFIFSPVGIGVQNGVQSFFYAPREGKVNKSILKKTSRVVELPIKTLQTTMQENNHKHIDVLRMNVEGSEFAVIPAILPVPIRQLVVQVHTSFFEGWKGLKRLWGRWQTKRLLGSLARRGFRQADYRLEGEDPIYTFLAN